MSVTGNMLKKKPNHARSAYLIRDLHLFLHYQAFSPLRVKKDAQLLKALGREHTLPLRAVREHMPAEHPKSHRAVSNPRVPAVCLWLFPITDSFSPPACKHPSPQPEEGRHLAGSFSGFHLEEQSNGFYSSPLLPGILKQDLPTGACKRAGGKRRSTSVLL